MRTVLDTRRRVSQAARAACTLAGLALSLAGCGDTVGPGKATFSCAADGTATVDGQSVAVAPGGYFSAGNQIIQASSCQPHRFVGVSRPSLSLSATGGRLGIDTATVADFQRIRAWGANAVRIELAEYYWVPDSRFHDAGYPARVQRVVRAARDAGLDVILALQNSDRGDPNYPANPDTTNMHQPMPDRRHSIPFWTDLATLYKGDGGVLFELYGEPYPIGGTTGFSNWDLWLHGGTAPADNVYQPRAAFDAVGMQELYDVVRGTGANNLVLISGTQWGYFLDGVPDHRIKGYNIAYATHPWDFVDPTSGKHQRPVSNWEKDWAFLTATDPVMVTEFGDYDCSESYVKSLLDRADQRGLSWIAWAWVAPNPSQSQAQTGPKDPICQFPMLITDWSGTPSKIGQLVKSRLATY